MEEKGHFCTPGKCLKNIWHNNYCKRIAFGVLSIGQLVNVNFKQGSTHYYQTQCISLKFIVMDNSQNLHNLKIQILH